MANKALKSNRDLDVYRSSSLDSLGQCFEEESWIVSQLASLAEDLTLRNSLQSSRRAIYACP